MGRGDIINKRCLLALVPLALLALACNARKNTAPTNTLIYARGGESQGLDPIHVDTGESVKVIINIYDTLLTYADDSTKLVPGLAQSWETSPDGRIWTFHLRPNVVFHDGTPLNAEAVKFSFERLIRDDHPYVFQHVIPYRPNYEEIQRIDVVDPLTVAFLLAEPSAVFEANLAMFPASIVSPTAVKKYGAKFTEHPVGTGPFRFERWVRDQEIVLSANSQYYRGAPGVQRVIFVPVKESAIRIKQLERGEAHLADDLPPAQLNSLPGLKLHSTEGMNVGYLAMQNDKPPLNDLRVRKAIWHAIDKKELIRLAYGGRAKPAVNPLPRAMWSWNDAIQDRPFDLGKARELMDEAEKAGALKRPITLDLFVMASPRPYMQQPQETAVFIKESLKPLGIDVRIVVSEISQHFQRISRGEHQLALSGWSSDNSDPDNFLYQLLSSENINDLGGNNVCHYRNAQVDAWVKQARRELDRTKREKLYRDAQQQIFDDAPMVPLVHTDTYVVVRPEVRGFKLHPTSLMWLRGISLGEKAGQSAAETSSKQAKAP